jgi:hypothetical protein
MVTEMIDDNLPDFRIMDRLNPNEGFPNRNQENKND